MNRRNFISKAFGALAGLVTLPLALANKSNVRTFPKVRQEPQPVTNGARRVFLMTGWYVQYGIEGPGTFISSNEESVDLNAIMEINPENRTRTEQDRLAMLWPRAAFAWRAVKFEELKRGDHFRLLDEPQLMQRLGNEDGKTVYIAMTDAVSVSKQADNWMVQAKEYAYPLNNVGAGPKAFTCCQCGAHEYVSEFSPGGIEDQICTACGWHHPDWFGRDNIGIERGVKFRTVPAGENL